MVAGDLEAFVQICKLYDMLPEPLDLRSDNTMQIILAHDQVDILDEYIRRSGDGIDIEGRDESDRKPGQRRDPRRHQRREQVVPWAQRARKEAQGSR